jgi:hypothetical protein
MKRRLPFEVVRDGLSRRLLRRLISFVLLFSIVPRFFHRPVDIVGAGNVAAQAVSPMRLFEGCGQPEVKR